MDLIDIVYHVSRAGFNNEDHNRLNDIIKQANKEYLYNQSFADVKEDIFKYAANGAAVDLNNELTKAIIKVLNMPCDTSSFEEMLHYMRQIIDLLYEDKRISESEHFDIDAWIDSKLNNL